MAIGSRRSRPSRWWTVVAAATALLSLAAALGAFLYQRDATRPIGEGQLFLREARQGLTRIDSWISQGAAPDEAVRRLRNDLGIEAVALMDPGGTVTASTSSSLLGRTITNPVLRFSLDAGRFGAVATPLQQSLQIDGVTEWEPGDALYLVLLPGNSGRNLLLYYDVSELLGRRAPDEGIRSGTVQLGAAAAFFALASVMTVVGRWRSVQRYREMQLEAEFLRKESESLQLYNAELEEARNEAEKALALAEEKNRIRSEFVLMINHELRTPLTSVVTGAELLRSSGDLGPEDQNILESLIADGRRLESMIDQLLAVARVENRGLAFTPRRMSLAEACHAVTGSHRRVVHRMTEEDHGPERDVEVMTDVQTLSHLVGSLVDNAYTHGATSVTVDCSPAAMGEPDLRVGDSPEPATAISVIDNGPGIRPEFLPRAFEKFEKDSRSSGTGLGLYMARLMAEALGAGLHVRTSPVGTTISIVLPLAQVRPKVAVA